MVGDIRESDHALTSCSAEPFFQDGVIAQAANVVARDRGVPYFSAAGNDGRGSWEGVFTPSSTMVDGCTLHDFGGGATM